MAEEAEPTQAGMGMEKARPRQGGRWRWRRGGGGGHGGVQLVAEVCVMEMLEVLGVLIKCGDACSSRT